MKKNFDVGLFFLSFSSSCIISGLEQKNSVKLSRMSNFQNIDFVILCFICKPLCIYVCIYISTYSRPLNNVRVNLHIIYTYRFNQQQTFSIIVFTTEKYQSVSEPSHFKPSLFQGKLCFFLKHLSQLQL